LPDARIALGSTLTQPLRDDAGNLLQFDLVLAEPPFSLPEWEYEAAARVSFGRFDAGLPPPRRGELAFVQHIAATLNARGRGAAVVPHGVLFRGGSEKQIRAAMLQPETDLVEAVIALPEGALLGHKAPSAILILNRNKPEARRGRVLFIDAALLARAFRLDEETRSTIVALYRSDAQREPLPDARVARSVSLREIAEKHDYNLKVARYVAAGHETHAWDINRALAEVEELDREKLAAEEAMKRLLKELGYGQA
jgi:type I restriction enzyme M protein